MSRDATRRRLLDAAAAVVRRDGPRALTLDTVAAQAGLSKGGLLYHFATKDALVDALVQDWLDRFEGEVVDGTRERNNPHARGSRWLIPVARRIGPRSHRADAA